MARLRTFIAIDLARPIRDRLIALQENLGRAGTEVKWVEPENLHVTLLFLGEVGMEDLARVCTAVAEEAGRRAASPIRAGRECSGRASAKGRRKSAPCTSPWKGRS